MALALRRLLQSVGVITGVTMITFITLHLGGDPTYLYVSEHASEADISATRAKLGFDQPLGVQYLRFAEGLLQGDLGDSLIYHTPALGVVLDRFPATLEITVCAMSIALLLGIPLGVLAAINHGRPLDGGIMLLALIGQSIPSFWLGLLALLFFGLKLWRGGEVYLVPEVISEQPLSGLSGIGGAIQDPNLAGTGGTATAVSATASAVMSACCARRAAAR